MPVVISLAVIIFVIIVFVGLYYFYHCCRRAYSPLVYDLDDIMLVDLDES